MIFNNKVFSKKENKESNLLNKISYISNKNNKINKNKNNLYNLNEYLPYLDYFNNYTSQNPIISNQKANEDYLDLIQKLLQLCNAKSVEQYQLCLSFFSGISKFLRSNTNLDLITFHVLENPQCKDQIMSITDYKNILELYSSTGKTLQDYGLEDECLREGHHYYFIKIWINNPDVYHISDFNSNMNKILNLTKWSLGFCFLSNCTDFVLQFGNKTVNEPFFNYLEGIGINKFEISLPKLTFEYSQFFLYFTYFFISYITLKLICSFFYIFLKSNRKGIISSKTDYDNYESDEEDSFSKDDTESSNSEYTINGFQEGKNILEKVVVNDSNISSGLINKKNKNGFSEYMQKFLKYSYEFFSFQSNFEHFGTPKNQYYDDSCFESINFLKILFLFLHTFNHVFYVSIKLPHRDFFSKSLFNSYMFGFFKLSTYSMECLLILEAFTMTYKLMIYVKINGPYLKTFLKFYGSCIPKIISFLIIYFIFHVNFQNFGNLITPSALFDLFLIERFKTKECYSNNAFFIFDLFKFCYGDQNPLGYKSCFKFTYFYINMFLRFNITLVIIYFSLKIISFKIVHLYVVNYFFGVLLGLFYFYISESKLNTSYIKKGNHLPFEFVYSYASFLNINRKDLTDNYLKDFAKNRTFRRLGLLLVSFVIMLILVFYFPLKLLIMGSQDILIPFSPDLKIIYYFEHYVFGFVFVICLSCMMVLEINNMIIKAFSGSRLLSVFGRICMSYFSMNDMIVYIFFTLYNIQLYFNYQNIFFLTIGLVTFIFIVSYMIVFLFELPVKKLIKIISKRFY